LHGILGFALIAGIQLPPNLSRASSLLRGRASPFPKPPGELLKSAHDPDASPQREFRQPRLAMVALI
jgi:hypothetical protein